MQHIPLLHVHVCSRTTGIPVLHMHNNDTLQIGAYIAEGLSEGPGACCHWIADEHQALQARQPNCSLHIVHCC